MPYLPEQVRDGCQGAGEVRVTGQLGGGCGMHVVVYPGAFTGQVLNVQHLKSLPADQAVSVQVFLRLLNRLGGGVIREGLNSTGKTLGDGDTVTQKWLHLLYMGNRDRAS